MDFETEISLFVSQTTLVRIIESVRTILLNWALKLEEQGVLGEGLSFTPEEKRAAGNSPQSINNFYGPVHGAQIQQGNPSAVQVNISSELDITALRSFLHELRGQLDGLGLPVDDRSEVEAEVQTAQVQIDSPKPKTTILRECLKSVRSILERASGTAAGKLLQDTLDKLL